MTTALERSWYRRHGWSLLLAPLSCAYGAVVAVRRRAYDAGWLHSVRMAVPVIVIGNITVGGSGKTPLTAYVAQRLQARGLKVGIVSRGYGGRARQYPLQVTPDTPATEAGDEPVLLAARGDAVVVDPVRARGARMLIEQCGVDIIIADDGMQHYALARDVEIAVMDAERGYGNGWLLPAGPLREPVARAQHADLTLRNGAQGDFAVVPQAAQRLHGDSGGECELAAFAGQRVHAVAGIGAPQRFFDTLRGYGMMVWEHAFADHHAFTAGDIDFGDDKPVMMTEKDAVKCRAWADRRHWYVPVSVRFTADGQQRLDAVLAPQVQRALQRTTSKEGKPA